MNPQCTLHHTMQTNEQSLNEKGDCAGDITRQRCLQT